MKLITFQKTKVQPGQEDANLTGIPSQMPVTPMLSRSKSFDDVRLSYTTQMGNYIPRSPQRLQALSDFEMDCHRCKSVEWENIVMTLPAEDKVSVRKAFVSQTVLPLITLCYGKIVVLERSDIQRKPSSISDFYERITKHMKSPLYWINYDSYASGDLASLAAGVATNARHGISMMWTSIGESDPEKNMKILGQYLGGIIDQEGREIFVVTDAGAKGRWQASSQLANSMPPYSKLTSEDKTYSNFERAAFSFMSGARYWLMAKESKELLFQTDPDVKQMETLVSVSMRIAELLMESANVPEQDTIYASIKELEKYTSPYLTGETIFIHTTPPEEWKSDFKSAIQLLQNRPPMEAFSQNVLKIALYSCRIAENIYKIQKGQMQIVWNILQNTYLTPNSSNDSKIPKISFTDGTKLVATHWNRSIRSQVRKTWGVDIPHSSNKAEMKYDSALSRWLSDKVGAKPEYINGKDIVVLWIRKSGERGGAHFENDTSFKALEGRVKDYLEKGYTVFLAGDEKAGKAAAISRRLSVFNVTQFWTLDSSSVASWGGDTRTGQFRLYDYLNRHAKSLTHIGARSGNLEAMALLGHKVEVFAYSPEEEGVSRMRAFETHDFSHSDEKDKISYNFKYIYGYDKKAASTFVVLKRYGRYFYNQATQGRYNTDLNTSVQNAVKKIEELKRKKKEMRERVKEIRSALAKGIDQTRKQQLKQEEKLYLKTIADYSASISELERFSGRHSNYLKKYGVIQPFSNQIVPSDIPPKQKSVVHSIIIKGLTTNMSAQDVKEKIESLTLPKSDGTPQKNIVLSNPQEFVENYDLLARCVSSIAHDISRFSKQIFASVYLSGSGHFLDKKNEQLFDSILIKAAKLQNTT